MKIIFYNGHKTLFSHLIYFKQRYLDGVSKEVAKYTHVELLFSDKVMYSSSERDRGVRGRYMPKLKDHWDIVDIKMSESSEQKIRNWCESQDGLKYDITGIVFAQILKTNWFLQDDEWFCSEFVTAALQEIGLCPNVAPHMITPADLYNLLK